MIEPINQKTFECIEHEKLYETLLKIVNEGTQKPNIGMIERLTNDVSPRMLHSSCQNTPWKKELAVIIKKEGIIWEENGGKTGKKLRESFQQMVKDGHKIEPKLICTQAKVKPWNLNKSALKYIWQKELYIKVKVEQKRWESYGGSDGEKGRIALSNMIKAGDQPSKRTVELHMNKSAGFLGPSRLSYKWKIRLSNAIIKSDKKWQKKGGKWLIELNKILLIYIKKGERPQLNRICDEVGYSATNILKGKYPWQIRIKNRIEEANREWDKTGGSDGEKCRKALHEIIELGELPTPGIVSRKAGFGSVFLVKNSFEWKLSLLKEIEKNISKGLTEVHVLYININLLIEKITVNPQNFNNYHRLGISVQNPKSGVMDYYTLSHIMYSSYHHGVKGNSTNRLFVNPNSYKSERKVFINGIINACEGMLYSNLIGLIPRMILAILWMGNKIPQTLEESKNIFREYSIYLHQMLKSSEKKHAVCHIEQKGMILLLSGMFLVEENEITKDYFSLMIPQKGPSSNFFSNAAKFTQEEFSYTFGFYFHLFDQVADFLLENKNYPYKIQLPRGHALIMGVTKQLIVPVHKMKAHGIICINSNNGNIFSDSELLKIAKENKVKYPNRYIKQKIKNLNKLSELNSNKTHDKRLQLGKKALDAWFMCMLYLTNTNDSILGTYQWSKQDEYEAENKERKEFITIKPRAQNKNIRFTIPKAFMPSFKKAIKLRKFVLNDNTFPYLFFQAGFGNTARTTRSQFSGGTSSLIANVMKNFLDDELPLITSQDIRRDGARDALQSHNVETALDVLQNNKLSLINNYNGFSSNELGLQINNLLNDIHQTAISEQPIALIQQNSMGGCKNNENLTPKTFNKKYPIEADCNDPKSCIFCEYYITFPEKEEIRKLLSLRYIIENVAYDRTEDESFYEKAMNPWRKRISTILNEMITKEPSSEEIINSTQIEVYNEGILSPYWLDWITDLDDLGRLS